MMSEEFKSSTLRMHTSDDDCPVCEFLSGKRDTETLLAVIMVLDDRLSQTEKQTDILLKAIARMMLESHGVTVK